MIPLNKLNDFASRFELSFLLGRTFEVTTIMNKLIADGETATIAKERYKWEICEVFRKLCIKFFQIY